jgi:hypothetical protein
MPLWLIRRIELELKARDREELRNPAKLSEF